MSVVNFSKKRKQLTAALGAVLSVSALLIAMERNGIIRRPESKQGERPTKGWSAPGRQTKGAVRGESITLDAELVRYRESVGAAFSQIESNIARLTQNQPFDQESLSHLQADLLVSIVPAVYQDLHLRLTGLAVHMQDKQKQDINFLREQSKRLLKDYPWLATPNQHENFQ